MRAFFKQHMSICTVICFVAAVFLVCQVTGLRICAVQSGSMEPEIPTYSMCLISTHIEYEAVEIGDVIVYTRAADKEQIIHRVVAITDAGIVTKGDANQADDGISVTPENLYGKYLGHIPYAAYLYNVMRSPYGGVIIVSLVIVLFVIEMIESKRK